MNIQSLLMVFLGGGLGSLFRYGIAYGMKPFEFTFPYATLAANILSCIVLGFLVSISTQLSDGVKLFLLVGFCGGFSTFSTFSNETFQLFQSGAHLQALLNIGGSILVCLGAIYMGMFLGKTMLLQN